MPTWLIWPIFAISGGLAVHAQQCDDYRYERCVAEYGDVCKEPREYVKLTKEWECP